MAVNILVVDKDRQAGMNLISELALPYVSVVFIDQSYAAIKSLKSTAYDLIVLGEKLEEGTPYDVAFEVKGSRKNNHTPVVCLGQHQGRTAKLVNVLRPYAISTKELGFASAVAKIRDHFTTVAKQ